MVSSIEVGGTWTTMEDVMLWKWRNALAKRGTTIEVAKILAMRLCKHKCGSVPLGKAENLSTINNVGEVVKNYKRFRIIPTGPTIVLNETSLHDSTASDSPLDSLMSQDSPIQKELRPISRKAVKAKRWSNSSNDTAKFLEQIARNGNMRIELDMKKDEDEKAMNEEYAREREYIRKQDIEKKYRETMTMDTSHMSPETKQFWKLEQMDVMRKRFFRDDGPSNSDWLNDQNH
ncbi:hypothetical protein L3X38_037763 [Prunus dulcis]|uniref:Uncharacterized protein n=1 Tax=Prunus dulcis TaxID=3755 RepID=A0AAD4YQX6_PRUDU|nr:hypothetical protein L3X38_037763 [Prunus dulcis]